MGIPTIIWMIPLERIRAAAERAAPHVLRSPMVPVEGASLKLECLQPTGSFKVRGFASALKGAKPGVEVIGVQSDGYAMWPRVFEAGGAVQIKPETIADGTTAPFDPRMSAMLKEAVDHWLVVPEPRLKSAIPELAAQAKVVAEGAGALAYAALEQLPPDRTTV